MNHEGTENTKKKKNEATSSSSGCRTCFTIFVTGFFIVALFCWGIPLFNLSIHYIQWRTQGIEEYEISFSYAGLGWNPPPYLEVVETDEGLMDMTTLQPHPDYDVINSLFSTALSNAFIPFCSNLTKYNDEYGFPSKVGCFFMEGDWVEVISFEPITND